MYVAASALRPGRAFAQWKIARHGEQAVQIRGYVRRHEPRPPPKWLRPMTRASSTRFRMSRLRPARLRRSPPRGAKWSPSRSCKPPARPCAIRLTLHTGPQGLRADGSDVALIDFEVVDAQGRRCPTDEARVDFAITGPGIWRGGLNSASSTHQQPLPGHRVRHQSRVDPLDPNARRHHPDRQARRPAAGDDYHRRQAGDHRRWLDT